MNARVAAASAIVIAALATPARAAPSPTDVQAAERLFEEGKALMGDRRFDEACSRFQESLQIAPGTGAHLALALCREGQGRIATAWTEYSRVLPAVRTDKRRDRAELVSRKLGELGARLPKVIVVSNDETAANLTVKIDGATVERAQLGAPLPVDPGDHEIEASAPSKAPWRATFNVGERATRWVDIPRLADLAPATARANDSAPQPQKSPGDLRAPLGLGLAAGGLATIAVGGFFGIRAIAKSNDAKSMCDPNACTDRGAWLVNDEAKSAATASTVSIAIGTAVLAGGIVLWLTAKPSRSATARVAIPTAVRF